MMLVQRLRDLEGDEEMADMTPTRLLHWYLDQMVDQITTEAEV